MQRGDSMTLQATAQPGNRGTGYVSVTCSDDGKVRILPNGRRSFNEVVPSPAGLLGGYDIPRIEVR